MDNLILCLMDEEEKEKFNFNLSDNYYTYKKNNLTIGYARVNVVEPYQIYIFINADIRGNGYGTKLFSEVLNILKNNSVTQIAIETPISNRAMVRILEHYNGKEVTRYDDIAHYIVPIV